MQKSLICLEVKVLGRKYQDASNFEINRFPDDAKCTIHKY